MSLRDIYPESIQQTVVDYYQQLELKDKNKAKDFVNNLSEFTYKKTIVSEDSFYSILERISLYHTLIVDTETTGLDYSAVISGVGIAIPDIKECFYFPINHFMPHNDSDFPIESIRWPNQLTYTQFEILVSEIFFKKHKLVFHNAKYDLKLFKQTLPDDFWGLVNYPWHQPGMDIQDTMLMIKCLESCESVALTACGKRWLGFNNLPEEARIKELCKSRKHTNLLASQDFKVNYSYYQLSPEDILIYATRDCETTALLWEKAFKSINDFSVTNLYNQELKLSFIVAEIEMQGHKIDSQYLTFFDDIYFRLIKLIKSDISELTGLENLEITKPSQVIKAFQNIGVSLAEVSQTLPGFQKDVAKAKRLGKVPKEVSTTEEVLLATNTELGKRISDHHILDKLKNTFIDGMRDKKDCKDFIHANFNQSGTVTGRFSSNNPNLQNIPREEFSLHSDLGDVYNELAKQLVIKKTFIPDNKDCVLLKLDYSQMELCMVAYLAGETVMLNAFKEGTDLHALTMERINKLMGCEAISRHQAKTLNFQILYGSGIGGLAVNLNTDYEITKMILESWRESYPAIQRMIALIKEVHSARYSPIYKGFVKSILGRRYVVKYGKEYILLNYLIQGGCAELFKEKIIAVYKYLKSHTTGRIVNLVHDEIVINLPKDEIEHAPSIKRIMEDFSTLGEGEDGSYRRPIIDTVQMLVEMKVCKDNWSEGVSYNDYLIGEKNELHIL